MNYFFEWFIDQMPNQPKQLQKKKKKKVTAASTFELCDQWKTYEDH